MKDNQCLVELDEVLEHLSYENLNKIPTEIRKAIKQEKDNEYFWKYDKTKTLGEQNLNRKTIAMLSYLNMEYLLNEKQKDAMKKIHDQYEKMNEEELREKYNPDNLFKKNETSNLNNKENTTVNEQVSMVKYKENIFKKIFRFIKKLFK